MPGGGAGSADVDGCVGCGGAGAGALQSVDGFTGIIRVVRACASVISRRTAAPSVAANRMRNAAVEAERISTKHIFA